MKYRKLIRDLVAARIWAENGGALIRKLDQDEMPAATLRKLVEESREALEVANDPVELKKELADVLEVLYTVLDAHSISRKELQDIRRRRARERGTFRKRMFLIETPDG